MKLLKLIIGTIFFYLLSGTAALAGVADTVHIRGSIRDFSGGNVTLMYPVAEGVIEDIIPVSPDGNFDYKTKLETPTRGILSFEDYACSVTLFLENGMDARLDISFHQEKDDDQLVNVVDVIYTGDNADCYQFLKDYEGWQYENWPFSRLDTMRFAGYREGYSQNVDAVKMALMKVKSLPFRRAMNAEIEDIKTSGLFRYAWSKPKKDADFERWVEAFDRNDPANIEMASSYLRWYLQLNPAAEGKSRSIYYLETLKRIYTNQDIINAFANQYIESYLKHAPGDMAEVFEVYKRTSNDTAAHARAREIYDHYKNMMAGAPAIDFDMTGVDGKKYHLSDFKGKAVYIDIWATWCGPCCAEIPHMEKLVKLYAKNKKIEFLSISLDENQKKWLKKLAADKPEWKQFICLDNFQSMLCREYDIDGIPRFMFFDKEGRIISLDAPRPSNPDIINYIDKNIN